MVLESVVKKLLTVLQRKEGTLIEGVVIALTHWDSRITCLSRCVQDLVVHVQSGIWWGIVSLLLLLPYLILRVASP